MNDLKRFIKSYWEYFVELEEQFLETKRFDTIRLSFRPKYGNREKLLGKIKNLYPNSIIEVLN